MISLKSSDDMKRIHDNGRILYQLFDKLETWLEPGMSTYDIDKFCEDFMVHHHVHPSCKGYCGYPAATCISVNDVVIHGIPSKNKIIKSGDIVSIDIVGDTRGNYFADTTRTFSIGELAPKTADLVRVTKECLELGIKAANTPGARIFDISRAVFNHATENGFSVVRDFCGHGVGHDIHEDPSVPNFIPRNEENIRLREGLVIAVEPMINMGSYKVKILRDGWTTITTDGKPSCHFEHTIGITKDGAIILTDNN